MLILSRRKDESIIIDGKYSVAVLSIRGDKVRLGVSAPAAVPVHRGEVHAAIEAGRGQGEGARQ